MRYLVENISQNKNNELVMIAMDTPYDEETLDEHVNELKKFIKDVDDDSFDYKIKGMHCIEKSGPISEMPDILSELADIQSIIGIV